MSYGPCICFSKVSLMRWPLRRYLLGVLDLFEACDRRATWEYPPEDLFWLDLLVNSVPVTDYGGLDILEIGRIGVNVYLFYYSLSKKTGVYDLLNLFYVWCTLRKFIIFSDFVFNLRQSSAWLYFFTWLVKLEFLSAVLSTIELPFSRFLTI